MKQRKSYIDRNITVLIKNADKTYSSNRLEMKHVLDIKLLLMFQSKFF